MNNTILPDYNNSIVNISNSILKHFGLETYHETIKILDEKLNENDYKNVVLILYDGMSSTVLDKHLEKNSFLQKNKIKDITTVFPATTTAATTSVKTGLEPSEHGWLGWSLYFKEIDKTVELFPNTIRNSREIAEKYHVAQKYLKVKTIMNRINEETPNDAYIVSPFDETRNYKEDSIDEMHQKIKEICSKDGRKYIYAYYTNPDHTAHMLGINSNEVNKIVNDINLKTEKLCEDLDDTLVIVTADHGLVDVENFYLEDYEELTSTLLRGCSIEPRACTFFVKEDCHDKFLIEFNKNFKDDFLLLTKQEVIDKKLFGEKQLKTEFTNFLGDYLAIGISDKCLEDKRPLRG